MNCPICTNPNTEPLLTIESVPVHCNVLCDSRDAALTVPRGDIGLTFCPNCAHLYNSLFVSEHMQYEQQYENSLHFSARFQAYAEALADDLIAHYSLRNKTIVEPGAGQGDFLRLLVTRGGNRGIGYDTSHVPLEDEHPDVRIEQSFLTDQPLDADLLVCRHVLEHVWDAVGFLQMMRRPQLPVFFEVPNTAFTLRNTAIWDLIYEHCHYFTAQSLAHLFVRAGFAVTRQQETFGGQFLTIDGVPQEDISANESAINSAELATFAQRFADKITQWQQLLETLPAPVVIWGTGSKGVTFLNVLPTRDTITYAVDINPRKHGKFVAGAGQEIVGVEQLVEIRPKSVIIMNRNYAGEITATLDKLNIQAEIHFA